MSEPGGLPASVDPDGRARPQPVDAVPGSAPHPAIASFWRSFCTALPRTAAPLRCLEVASGGALVAALQGAFDASSVEVTCVDPSAESIRDVQARFPGVRGIVAEPTAVEPESRGFDAVATQFGTDAAGVEALSRLLAPGGRLALLAPCRHGSLYESCRASLDAIGRTRESRFIPLSLRLFETGFAAIRGESREPYERAGRELDGALRALDSIFEEHGPQVAGGAIRRLYDDVARIHERLASHDSAEVSGWLRRMDGELAAAATRLSSLCESALDRAGLERLADRLGAAGLSVLFADELADPAGGLPLAWAVVAERPRHDSAGDGPAVGEPAARLTDWAKRELGQAVQVVLGRGSFPGAIVEAKPAWAVAKELVLGRLRRPGESEFFWIIGGAFPADCIPSTVAPTPREAARHFVLRWQLEAARARQAGTVLRPGADADELERAAERLFGLVRNDAVWPPEAGSGD